MSLVIYCVGHIVGELPTNESEEIIARASKRHIALAGHLEYPQKYPQDFRKMSPSGHAYSESASLLSF